MRIHAQRPIPRSSRPTSQKRDRRIGGDGVTLSYPTRSSSRPQTRPAAGCCSLLRKSSHSPCPLLVVILPRSRITPSSELDESRPLRNKTMSILACNPSLNVTYPTIKPSCHFPVLDAPCGQWVECDE
ncbi:hypothetical protein BDV98DRAFT_402779 [Pterulicium gracile]|uniref:Uncharacterized protein n=1 Tax=Pterulicium gracile TaxID=1884261 RepID=A0A5C3PZP8_9AGAR|nr:hypothetical protein BDV98DRAFT_402779 [Pterula gracilis]